jgi:hypothetical protein
MSETQNLLDDLMSWKLPEGTAEAVARLYRLQGRVEALVGRKLVRLPKSPALLRNRLLELVEDHFESASG